ncbi:hypothetical protein GCM10009691_33030 [Brevibacterium picturae]|uniref:Uncharacterized protein n=1 Tax=Brevibacterium picturae TaxID=260553 RepID=A0ABN2CCA3_9MICO
MPDLGHRLTFCAEPAPAVLAGPAHRGDREDHTLAKREPSPRILDHADTLVPEHRGACSWPTPTHGVPIRAADGGGGQANEALTLGQFRAVEGLGLELIPAEPDDGFNRVREDLSIRRGVGRGSLNR